MGRKRRFRRLGPMSVITLKAIVIPTGRTVAKYNEATSAPTRESGIELTFE
jgi:hypothetical protein